MPIITTPYEFNEDDLYVDLRSFVGHPLYLKCEGFNFAGSVKLKAANSMVESAERSGLLRPGSILVESSSGNLGVALSMIAASTTEPPVGASTWASGGQVCTGHIGTFTAKAMKKARKIRICSFMPSACMCQRRMSKVFDTLYR